MSRNKSPIYIGNSEFNLETIRTTTLAGQLTDEQLYTQILEITTEGNVSSRVNGKSPFTNDLLPKMNEKSTYNNLKYSIQKIGITGYRSRIEELINNFELLKNDKDLTSIMSSCLEDLISKLANLRYFELQQDCTDYEHIDIFCTAVELSISFFANAGLNCGCYGWTKICQPLLEKNRPICDDKLVPLINCIMDMRTNDKIEPSDRIILTNACLFGLIKFSYFEISTEELLQALGLDKNHKPDPGALKALASNMKHPNEELLWLVEHISYEDEEDEDDEDINFFSYMNMFENNTYESLNKTDALSILYRAMNNLLNSSFNTHTLISQFAFTYARFIYVLSQSDFFSVGVPDIRMTLFWNSLDLLCAHSETAIDMHHLYALLDENVNISPDHYNKVHDIIKSYFHSLPKIYDEHIGKLYIKWCKRTNSWYTDSLIFSDDGKHLLCFDGTIWEDYLTRNKTGLYRLSCVLNDELFSTFSYEPNTLPDSLYANNEIFNNPSNIRKFDLLFQIYSFYNYEESSCLVNILFSKQKTWKHHTTSFILYLMFHCTDSVFDTSTQSDICLFLMYVFDNIDDYDFDLLLAIDHFFDPDKFSESMPHSFYASIFACNYKGRFRSPNNETAEKSPRMLNDLMLNDIMSEELNKLYHDEEMYDDCHIPIAPKTMTKEEMMHALSQIKMNHSNWDDYTDRNKLRYRIVISSALKKWPDDTEIKSICDDILRIYDANMVFKCDILNLCSQDNQVDSISVSTWRFLTEDYLLYDNTYKEKVIYIANYILQHWHERKEEDILHALSVIAQDYPDEAFEKSKDILLSIIKRNVANIGWYDACLSADSTLSKKMCGFIHKSENRNQILDNFASEENRSIFLSKYGFNNIDTLIGQFCNDFCQYPIDLKIKLVRFVQKKDYISLIDFSELGFDELSSLPENKMLPCKYNLYCFYKKLVGADKIRLPDNGISEIEDELAEACFQALIKGFDQVSTAFNEDWHTVLIDLLELLPQQETAEIAAAAAFKLLDMLKLKAFRSISEYSLYTKITESVLAHTRIPKLSKRIVRRISQIFSRDSTGDLKKQFSELYGYVQDAAKRNAPELYDDIIDNVCIRLFDIFSPADRSPEPNTDVENFISNVLDGLEEAPVYRPQASQRIYVIKYKNQYYCIEGSRQLDGLKLGLKGYDDVRVQVTEVIPAKAATASASLD